MPTVYTLSTNFFINLGDDEFQYLGSILSPFTNSQSPCKLAVDVHCDILEQYKAITCGRIFADIIKGWLDLLANLPCSMQKYDIDLSPFKGHEEMCIELCSKVNGNKCLIIHSACSFHKEKNDDNTIIHHGELIHIIDKDEAKLQLNNNVTYNISNSMVAGGNITKSNNL